jgi:hypothetical protein
MAIHDREYSSRPQTFEEFRWRLQYLAELGVGRLIRREQQHESEVFAEMQRRSG